MNDLIRKLLSLLIYIFAPIVLIWLVKGFILLLFFIELSDNTILVFITPIELLTVFFGIALMLINDIYLLKKQKQ